MTFPEGLQDLHPKRRKGDSEVQVVLGSLPCELLRLITTMAAL